MNDIEQFRRIAQPPPWALKKIGGGRLKGMTDIKPAWRIQAMTEVYGLCGIHWKYEVVNQRTVPGPESQVFAFVDVNLYYWVADVDEWSAPIPGTGGSMLIAKETGGLHANDEAFKMATTDALSTAMKMIGMGHDVYAGQWTGSKYKNQATPEPKLSVKDTNQIRNAEKGIAEATSSEQIEAIGNATKEEQSPAVQNVLRPLLVERYRELKAKEKSNEHSRSDQTADPV